MDQKLKEDQEKVKAELIKKMNSTEGLAVRVADLEAKVAKLNEHTGF